MHRKLKVIEKKTKDEEDNRTKQQKEKLTTVISQMVADQK